MERPSVTNGACCPTDHCRLERNSNQGFKAAFEEPVSPPVNRGPDGGGNSSGRKEVTFRAGQAACLRLAPWARVFGVLATLRAHSRPCADANLLVDLDGSRKD